MHGSFSKFAAVILLAVCPHAQAQPTAGAWPNRPIRIQIALAAGGLTDVLARAVTDRVALTIGQPFILENKPGAGGNLATSRWHRISSPARCTWSSMTSVRSTPSCKAAR